MKKYFLIFSMVIALFACGNNKTNEKTAVEESLQNAFSFKIIGLNDSIISDSIWKMIFTVDGINQMSIRTDDSTIVIEGEKSLTKETLLEEIKKRGGVIVNP